MDFLEVVFSCCISRKNAKSKEQNEKSILEGIACSPLPKRLSSSERKERGQESEPILNEITLKEEEKSKNVVKIKKRKK